ncbi:acetyl-CoA hydrolase/transferase family protein [Vibrio parahaemolyticus]|nr:acetyl-CoA hydrolase/transferase C-terminal domain-containing protein [Vibrio parahaemolyticus]
MYYAVVILRKVNVKNGIIHLFIFDSIQLWNKDASKNIRGHAMNINNKCDMKIITLEDAASKINSGDRVWAGGYLSVPVCFLHELGKRACDLENTTLYSGLLTYPYEFLKPEYLGHLNYNSLFMGPLEKKFQHGGNAKIVPYHLSNADEVLIQANCNVSVIEVTPPNAAGYVSLGACGGVGNKYALASSELVIGVINEYQPFISNDDNLVHVDDFDFFTIGSHRIAGPKPEQPGQIEKDIASHVLPLIPNGSTIQIGIGTISNALGMGLIHHKDLGIHTEMFTESMMELCKLGVINGSQKNYKPNKIVAAFAAGSQELIDFVDGNDNIEIGDVCVVNDPVEIAKNDNFVSINTCIMVDLTGQVASEGIGHQQISGSGGQVDFVRGARMSNNGLSIIALASTHKDKKSGIIDSTIKLALPEGTPITTLRNDVQIIVTEYGYADLRGLTTNARAQELIKIAHPDFRNKLIEHAKAVGLL